jgi:hypothetical protein
MSEENLIHKLTENPEDVPVPVVNFSRWVNLITLLISIIFQRPLITTLLLLLVIPSLLLGKKWNIIGRTGKALLLKRNNKPLQFEDRRLIRFNNIILITLLTIAQIFFVFKLNIIAWSAVVLVIIANGLALAGFCVGCVIYYKFKIYKYKIIGKD